MGLLDKHVSVLKSEELVLGCSGGWKGEAGTKQADLESTKLVIVSESANKTWIGYTTVEQSIADASVGSAMAGKQFPARCYVSYKRVAAVEKKTYEGRETSRDVEKLVVVGLEYLCAVDLVDIVIKDKKAA